MFCWICSQMYSLLLGHSYEKPRTNRPQPVSKKKKKKKPQPLPQPGHRKMKTRPLRAKTPLEGFFSRYPNYKYRPSKSPKVEFDRLCNLYASEWEEEDWKRRVARRAFNAALKEEFDVLYGLDEHDIKNWHKLCHVLRINPVPDTLQECRAVSYRSSNPLCP